MVSGAGGEVGFRAQFEVSSLLGGSWDLVSMVISTLRGVISNYKYTYLLKTLVTKSHDNLSRVLNCRFYGFRGLGFN